LSDGTLIGQVSTEAGGGVVGAYRYTGTAWEQLGGGWASDGDIACDDGDVAVDSNGQPIATWSGCDGEIRLRQLDGSTWQPIVGSDSTIGVTNSFAASGEPRVGCNNGVCCVAWIELGDRAEQVLVRCAGP